mmetsp:Transcript_59600/g.122184  ORF Transcript_59600/g.122184 Transcript_59600/m.122184 type:complete len:203 (+) Transcript_59600:464-1072(+)
MGTSGNTNFRKRKIHKALAVATNTSTAAAMLKSMPTAATPRDREGVTSTGTSFERRNMESSSFQELSTSLCQTEIATIASENETAPVTKRNAASGSMNWLKKTPWVPRRMNMMEMKVRAVKQIEAVVSPETILFLLQAADMIHSPSISLSRLEHELYVKGCLRSNSTVSSWQNLSLHQSSKSKSISPLALLHPSVSRSRFLR